MNLKLLFIIPVLSLAACVTPQTAHKDPIHNPQGLNQDDLIKTQIARIEKLEREMERRENDLKYQHMKELHQVQIQSKSPHTVNTNCKFFCF